MSWQDISVLPLSSGLWPDGLESAVCDRRRAPKDHRQFCVREGEIIAQARPASFAKAMRGLHKQVWAKIDVDRWLAEGRRSWG